MGRITLAMAALTVLVAVAADESVVLRWIRLADRCYCDGLNSCPMPQLARMNWIDQIDNRWFREHLDHVSWTIVVEKQNLGQRFLKCTLWTILIID